MIGTVTNYYHDKGYGFIMGDGDYQKYFVHHSKLNEEYIQKGYRVFFRPYSNDRSDYNAKDIIVIESEVKPQNRRKK